MGKGIFKQIDPHDISVTPFKVYKSWGFQSTEELSALNIDRYQAIKPNPKSFSGGKVTLDTNEVLFDSSSLYYNIADNRESAVYWYSLNNMYYKQENRVYESYGISDDTHTRYLYDNASILSLPQKRIGERIQPNSVKIRYESSLLHDAEVELVDDGRGNLIDINLPQPISHQLLYLGFNSMTYADNYRLNSTENHGLNSRLGSIDTVICHSHIPDISVTSKNVWIGPKLSQPTSSLSWGNSALFYRDGYIRIGHTNKLNFKSSQDYAISFWFSPRNEDESFTYILSKRSTKKIISKLSSGVLDYSDSDNLNLNSQYPYEITYDNDTATLTGKYSTGANVLSINAVIDPGAKSHVVLQKTGSVFELYINGVIQDYGTCPVGNIHNDSDVFIGSLGTTLSTLNVYTGAQAAIDEFFMFEKALAQEEIDQLSFIADNNLMTTNTNIVGNVYYDHGIIVVSDPRPKYGTSSDRLFNDVLVNSYTSTSLPNILDSFYFEYKSTVSLYEHEYVIRLRSDEFNFTSNPTIRLDDDENSDVPKEFVSNLEFGPYITTIGLYNKYGQLLAVGKLGTPIKKREDVDLNFVIRFDT